MLEYVDNPHSKNMVRFGKQHPEALVLSGDLTGSTEIIEFREQVPEQFVSMGMAEQNMLSWAGGLTREGYVPYLHTFSVFLYRRPYDQLAMSVAYPNLKVRLVGFLPGIMTPGGVTHQAIEDISVLRGLPNMTIVETGDATDVETVLDAVHEIEGPVYIRMLRGRLPRLFPQDEPFEVNKARVLMEGSDLLMLSSGICTEEAMRACEYLRTLGIQPTLLHISTLKPFTDPTVVAQLTKNFKQVLTVENHNVIGGLGTAVAEVMAENGVASPLVKLGIPDQFAHGASKEYLMDKFKLNAKGIAQTVIDLLGVSATVDESQLQNTDLDIAGTIKQTQLEAL